MDELGKNNWWQSRLLLFIFLSLSVNTTIKILISRLICSSFDRPLSHSNGYTCNGPCIVKNVPLHRRHLEAGLIKDISSPPERMPGLRVPWRRS